jgi:hypothetical protein
MMDKVQKRNNSEWYMLLTEPFRFDLKVHRHVHTRSISQFKLVVLFWLVVNLASSTEMTAVSSQGRIHKLKVNHSNDMKMKFRSYSDGYLSSQQMATWCSSWSLLSSLGTHFAARYRTFNSRNKICHHVPYVSFTTSQKS